MSFDTEGFLSPTLERFRVSIREVPAFKLWFQFAEEINRLALVEMLPGYEVPCHDNQRLVLTALFVGVQHSFQATVLLSERGLLGDARVVLRSAVEGAIALNAIASDATFVEQMIGAHRFHQRKIARLTLNNPDYHALYSAAEIGQLQVTVAEVDAEEAAAGKKFAEINWADVAGQYCKDLYELPYRLLSWDGTHININAVHRHLQFDPTGQLTSLKVGPTIDGMVGVLKAACLTFLAAADPFARAANQGATRAKIQGAIERFAALPMDEPTGVTVTTNFWSQA